jgi:uncharacterized protein (TIGR02186 family)
MNGMRRLRPLLILLLLTAGLVVAPPHRATTNALVADLSDHLVAITTGFAGTEVLLFGAVEGSGDVVVTVRGPSRPITMRRKSRVAGIWMNTAAMTFERAPSFYAVSASGPLQEIAAPTVRARHGLGVDNLELPLPPAKASPNVAAEWRAALIRAKQRQGLYAQQPGRVAFLGDRLFRTRIQFPANVPVGSYQVDTYLLNEGRVVGAQTTPLIVSKVGVEAQLFQFAYRQSAAYGLVAILIALLSGWGGYALFRKT